MRPVERGEVAPKRAGGNWAGSFPYHSAESQLPSLSLSHPHKGLEGLSEMSENLQTSKGWRKDGD